MKKVKQMLAIKLQNQYKIKKITYLDTFRVSKIISYKQRHFFLIVKKNTQT